MRQVLDQGVQAAAAGRGLAALRETRELRLGPCIHPWTFTSEQGVTQNTPWDTVLGTNPL